MKLNTAITPEDRAIVRRLPTIEHYEMRNGDMRDYRAMLAREEHRADGRAPGECTRRPGQWVNMVETLKGEAP